MNLLEAFREIGPVQPDDRGGDSNARRQEAARVLWPELQRLARFLRSFPDDIVEAGLDAVCTSLIVNGPRGARPNEPETDAGTRGFLYVWLKRRTLDALRAQGGIVEEPITSFEQHLADECAPPDEAADLDRAHAALVEAWRCLGEEFLPAVLAPRSAAAAAIGRRSYRELFEISQGRREFSDVLAEHRAEQPTKTPGQVRAMLDTRYKRLRQALQALLEERRERLGLWQEKALALAIGQLRLKAETTGQEGSTSRVLADEEGDKR